MQLVILAKEETVLQGVIDRLIEIGIRYETKINVQKNILIRILRQPSPVQIMID
jgi:hypothetical protein